MNELKIDEPKSDEARAQSNECMEINEAKEEKKEEYLSKHYIKPKVINLAIIRDKWNVFAIN